MFFATYKGIYTLSDDGSSEPVFARGVQSHRCLGGRGNHRAMAVLPERQTVVLALLDGRLMLWAKGPSQTVIARLLYETVWITQQDYEKYIETGIEEPIASLLVIREKPLTLLIGTDQGAHLYRFTEGEGPAERVVAFDELACREEWYTPWGGPPSIWSLAKTGDGYCYADIHVGSIMRSPDEGISWEPVTPELNKDVHHVTTCPAADDNVYANTANGVYVSTDRGHSWEHRVEGLPLRYGVAIAVHPTDPNLLIAAVQNGPGGGKAYLCRSENGGKMWTPINERLTKAAISRIIPNSVKFASDGTAWAIIGNTLYVGQNGGEEWRALWTAPDYDGEYEPPSDEYSLSYLLEYPIQTLAV